MNDSTHADQFIAGLMEKYTLSIYRLALSILDDPDDAEDAVQESFIAAAAAEDDFRGESSPRTWLYSIAINTCRGMLRKRSARRSLLQAWRAVQLLLGRQTTPEQDALVRESHAQIATAVQALDEKHRLVVLLRYVHNLPVAEIAAILGASEGTVHSRLHYARRRLMDQLEGEHWLEESTQEVIH